MNTTGLIMAGGQGERMRQSFGALAKPLVPIRGVPLLERNLFAMFRAGIERIVVSVPVGEPEIGHFVLSRGAELAKAVGARISVLEETRPLGNIGCAGQLRESAETVLVAYADNLMTLDLSAILESHLVSGAAMTLATHYEPFRMPYGEVKVTEGRVVDYREKPVLRSLVCSAVTVLGGEALGALPDGEAVGLRDLFWLLHNQDMVVNAYHHSAPWIDVNDASAVERAEKLIGAHQIDFDCWAARPNLRVAAAVVRGPDGLLLEKQLPSSPYLAEQWCLPSALLNIDENAEYALAKHLSSLGFRGANLQPLGVFDEVCANPAPVVRHFVFATEGPGADVESQENRVLLWASPDDLMKESAATPVFRRVLGVTSVPQSTTSSLRQGEPNPFEARSG